MSDGVLGTGLDAETAEDAAAIIDVVNGCVTFIDTDALFGWSRIVGGNDVDAFRRTGGRAEITGHTLLASELVNVQQVLSAVTRLDGYGFIGILDGPLALGNVGQRHTHSLDDCFS